VATNFYKFFKQLKMKILHVIVIFILLQIPSLFAQKLPIPAARQLAWQQWETTAFLHFTVNTFTDKEWGDGTENPQIFNPTEFDAKRIVKTLKETGFKLVLLTAKHHDGFCLWQTQTTEHCVRNSPYKNGKGDIVGEIAAACKEMGLKFGVYLSPWDRHESSYGTANYNDFYKKQLRELLTHYGKIHEVWFDGAKGENAKNMTYDFKGYWALVRQLQPDAVMFSDAGPDVRWVGNEAGNAGETCWATINTEGMAPGVADSKYLNTGDADGKLWLPAETDVSIRPGWFWHEKENDKVRSGRNIMDLYYKSVGRNSLLLLNIPPDRRGLLHENDIANLQDFYKIKESTFKNNLLKNKALVTLTDKKLETAYSFNIAKSIEIDLGKMVECNRAMIQENILHGQRIKIGRIEYWDGKEWQFIQDFTTVGYKRLLRFAPIKASKIRISVLQSKTPIVEISELGLYMATEED
jgi:alpha-L-fucosidase